MNSLDHITQAVIDPATVDLEDPAFLVPCFDPSGPLVQSVSVNGLICPPFVKQGANGRLVPVLGRRRLHAAVRLGLTSVDVRCVPAELPEAECFALAFWDNVGHRKLDTATVAFLTARLLDLFPEDRVIAEFLPVLGIAPKGPRLERLRVLGHLGLPVLEALAHGRIMEKTAYLIARLGSADRALVTNLIGVLGLNANKAAELVEDLTDLSVFNATPLAELVGDPAAREVLDADDLPVSERASRFRALVRSWKYPELSAREREFRQWLGSMSLPGNLSVRPTRSFEDPGCTVEIRVVSLEEAGQMIEKVRC